MKLKELLKKHQDLELTEEQEKRIKDYLGIKDSKKWIPEENEGYWYVDAFGDVDVEVFAGDSEDEYKIFTNNCFKTEKEANFRLEQIEVYNELKNFADENNDESVKGCRFLLTFSDNKLTPCAYTYLHQIGEIVFSSKEIALQAIEKIGEDRIKKYLFGVE